MTAPPSAHVAGAARAHARLVGACSPSVRDRLAGPRRTARVLHRGHDAVYVEHDGWALGVVSARASRVPCALWLTATADADLAAVDHVEVGDHAILLDDTRVEVGRLADVRVPRLSSPALVPGIDAGLVAVLDRHTGLARAELGELSRPDPVRLLGRGSGLTPLGDDVLAGWSATAVALGAPEPVIDGRGRTTLFSATLLRHAGRGEVLPEFRAVLAALAAGDRELLDNRAATLAAIGHTSGSGLLLGAVLRLQEATTHD